TLGNLESFVRAAEVGSFSEAARQMGVSAAAVSKNVARLETRLETRLFHRNTRSLTLTEAGEAFYSQVAGSLETIQGAIAQLGAARDVPADRQTPPCGGRFTGMAEGSAAAFDTCRFTGAAWCCHAIDGHRQAALLDPA
nr:hypothetical protein [Tanacetum cinerariifolium]